MLLLLYKVADDFLCRTFLKVVHFWTMENVYDHRLGRPSDVLGGLTVTVMAPYLH